MNYPLLFSTRVSVTGRDFTAEVELSGRLLMSVEMEGVWLYGVNPGGVAAHGKSLKEADVQLRETLCGIFNEFAGESTSFAGFETAVRSLVETTNGPNLDDWNTAVEQVRNHNLNMPERSKRLMLTRLFRSA